MKKLLFLLPCIFLQTAAMDTHANRSLSTAAWLGDLQSVKKALQNGANLNYQNYMLNWTALMWASIYGRTKVVKFLIAAGADVNLADKNGSTPLMSVSNNGDFSIASILIAAGAEVNAQVKGVTALFLASAKGHSDIVKLLLHFGAEVNTRDKNGMTPLTKASIQGYKEVVKLLIASGAEMNLDTFESAIKYASRNGKAEIVTFLKFVKAFLDNPLEQIAEHPNHNYNYLLLSIAYKKNQAFDHLFAHNPEMFTDLTLVAQCFLQAARTGNETSLRQMRNLLKKEKRPSLHVVLLKAIFYLDQLHPELSDLTWQILAEDMAPNQTIEAIVRPNY